MQFYALNEKKQLIHARYAQKNFNYSCVECQTRVRVRGGVHRQLHFYHLSSQRSCHLHNKGMPHLQLQYYFLQTLPENDCHIEYRFPQIKRIADVAWLSKKIVFEIQYSPISVEDIKQRTEDYQSIGWSIVWILHDHRYNQKFLSPAEKFLLTHSHYFTDMCAKGNGIIYDQFALMTKGFRRTKMEKILIDISQPQHVVSSRPFTHPLQACKVRLEHWKLSFKGDLLDSSRSNYQRLAADIEKKYFEEKFTVSFYKISKALLTSVILQPYRIFFRYILEKACR